MNKIFYKVYHGNLAFSSIEEKDIPMVIDRVYSPLLNLVFKYNLKIALELGGYTLEMIYKYRPLWIDRFKKLCKIGLMEFIGSGYMQIIAPLIPYEVNLRNQQIGLDVYKNLLDIIPGIAFVNEQTFSKSLVDLYDKVGYKAIIMEWNNAFDIHRNWQNFFSYQPIIARGIKKTIPVLWSDTVLSQQFQRVAYREQNEDEFLEYLKNHINRKHKVVPLYCSDLEVFNYRPGRFETEKNICEDEWKNIASICIKLREKGYFELPSEVLKKYLSNKIELNLTNSANAIIVKKQDKYSLGRWAACGMDSNYINTLCFRYYNQIRNRDNLKKWKILLRFWGSDFRTHITSEKWNKAIKILESKLKSHKQKKIQKIFKNDIDIVEFDKRVIFQKDDIKIFFLREKGLALEEMYISGIKQKFGTIKHGEFISVKYVADFFTGSSVIESAMTKKITDLKHVDKYNFEKIRDKIYKLSCTIKMKDVATETKSWIINISKKSITLHIKLRLHQYIYGSIRIGTFTLLPHKSHENLYYSCKNGGKNEERYVLKNSQINHHLSKSLLQSAQGGLGVTNGNLIFSTKKKIYVLLKIDKKTSYPFILLQNNPIYGKYLTRVFFSLGEIDDTLRKYDKKIDRTLELKYTIYPMYGS